MTRAQRIRRRKIRKFVRNTIILITGILLFVGITLMSGVIGPNDEINLLQAAIGIACILPVIPVSRAVCGE